MGETAGPSTTLRFGRDDKGRGVAQVQVPKSYFTGGAVGYVYACFLVTDGNGHNLWIQPQAYDVRGVNSNGNP
jgi:hypothetical protein